MKYQAQEQQLLNFKMIVKLTRRLIQQLLQIHPQALEPAVAAAAAAAAAVAAVAAVEHLPLNLKL